MKRSHLAMLAILAVAAIPGASRLGADASEAADSVRETVAKWVETQGILARERRDWQIGREVLGRRIALLEGEIATLEGKLEETKGALGDAQRRRAELVSEKRGLEGATEALGSSIRRLEVGVRGVLPRLPEPIRERVAPLSQRVPKEDTPVTLSLSQRYQNVIGILNEVNKFQREVTVTNEIRSLPDGSRAEVQTIYFGLGQAYFVTPDGRAAGVGRPTAEGWGWEPANDLATSIRQAIAIVRNDAVPSYVPLPVAIR